MPAVSLPAGCILRQGCRRKAPSNAFGSRQEAGTARFQVIPGFQGLRGGSRFLYVAPSFHGS
jgi:hypothetical protein